MGRSRFADVADALAAADAPAIYPSQRLRMTWRAFRRVFDELAYRPIWRATPATLDDADAELVAIALFLPLARCGEGLLPRFATALSATDDAMVSRLTAFGWLETAYEELEAAFARDLRGAVEHRIAARPIDDAAGLTRGRRQADFERLIAAARQVPAEIAAVLLQGSLADGRIEDGFSDADVIAIVESPSRLPRRRLGESFAAAARWLLTLNRELLAFNPLMHHGPTATFRLECDGAAEATAPSAVFDHGCWLHGSIDRIAYHDGELENVLVFGVFEHYFEVIAARPASIGDGFDALWWTSNTLILPVLVEQLETRRSVWKRDCLESRRPVLSPESWAVIGEVEAVRVRLARHLSEHLGAPDALDPHANPGLLITRARARTTLTEADRLALGLTDALFDGVRGVWEEAAARALARHAGAVARAGRDAPPLIAWPTRTHTRPRALAPEAYADARAAVLGRCAGVPGVRAVFQFGAIECPGLSDLDLLVVLDDAVDGVPDGLRVAALDPLTAYVLDHDPLFVGEAAAGLVAAVFPLFGATQVWGAPFRLPVSEDYSADVRLAATTALNLRKYDDDVEMLSQATPTPWRTVLAYLHSIVHLERAAAAMDRPSPAALVRGRQLDAEIRRRFATEQVATQADLRYALLAISEAAAEMRALTVDYWRHRCPRLRDLLEIGGAWRGEAVELGATWLRAELSDVRMSQPGASATTAPFGEYLTLKRRFIALETARHRDISPYVQDPILSQLARGARPASARRQRTELLAVNAWLGEEASAGHNVVSRAEAAATDAAWLWLQASGDAAQASRIATLTADAETTRLVGRLSPAVVAQVGELADLAIGIGLAAAPDALERVLDEAAARLRGDGMLAFTTASVESQPETTSEIAAALARHAAFHEIRLTSLPGDDRAEANARVGVHARLVPRDCVWQFGAEWHDAEHVGRLSHRWSAGRASMRIWTASSGPLWIDADLYSLVAPNVVEVWAADRRIAAVSVDWEGFAPIRLGPFELSAGRHEIWWHAVSGPWYAAGDSRALAFALRSTRLSTGHEGRVGLPGGAERG